MENEILSNAQSKALDILNNHLPKNLFYHNISHTEEVVGHCEEAADYYEFSEEEKCNLLLAAWFHDVGFSKKYDQHEKASAEIAASFLKEQEYSKEAIQKILGIIESTHAQVKPKTLSEKIINDADLQHMGKKSFFSKGDLLRLEWEKKLGKSFSHEEWAAYQLNFIDKADFYTKHAQEKYSERKEKNIKKQRKELHKIGKKKKKRGRGVETMYRAVYRNHINLSAIADAKANMMISINTIIMSVIVTAGTGFSFTGKAFINNFHFVIPVLILLLGALISLIFAVLSARPKVTQEQVSEDDIQQNRKSLLFFGSFIHMECEQFVSWLREFRDQQDRLYDNMSVDIYALGLVLTKKYRLLRISYNLFMGALVLCVLAFLLVFFIYPSATNNVF